MRDIGVPVARELARSRLPGWIEAMPDAYVSIPFALDFIARCRDAPAIELGFLAARRASLATFSHAVRTAILAAPTGSARVAALARMARRENSAVRVHVRREGADVRIVADLVGFRDDPSVGFVEWLNLQALVSVVRSAAGPAWCPSEMTFVSRSRPSEAALEAYGDTRLLVGQPQTSIVVPAAVLARRCPVPGGAGHRPLAEPGEAWDFAEALRTAIRPYLGDGYPDLALAAEIAGLSRRTLQRRLAASGRSYSDLVQEARFDIARDLLADPGRKVIDVALAAGYESPQHFTRAFRRLSGITPTAYRSGLEPSRRAAQR